MAVNTYYFDGSDVGATDPDGVWTNDSNAFDGSTSTSAYTNDQGSIANNYLTAEGTNAPTTGGTISQVRYRVYSSSGWSSYSTINPYAGGDWSWIELSNLKVKLYFQGFPSETGVSEVSDSNGIVSGGVINGLTGSGRLLDVHRVEIEVTSADTGRQSISSRSAISSRSSISSRSVVSGRTSI